MPLDFDRLEQRILGVLIEKEMTVPETYPLTLGSLVAGCNQKSNREPQMSVEPYEVEGALRSLMDREFVVRMERAGGRTPRSAPYSLCKALPYGHAPAPNLRGAPEHPADTGYFSTPGGWCIGCCVLVPGPICGWGRVDGAEYRFR